MAVGAHARIRKRHPVQRVDHRRHFLQIDLVHDPVAWRNHFHVLERTLGPFDEVEAIGITPIFHAAILGERLLVEAGVFHCQRVIHNQLHRHHRIDLRRVAALLGNGIAQARKIHQCGLAQDVVTHHPRRKPREIQIALALDQLPQVRLQQWWLCPPHQVLGMHACGVWQGCIRTGLQRIDGGACIEVIQRGARQGLAVLAIHGWRYRSGRGNRESGIGLGVAEVCRSCC